MNTKQPHFTIALIALVLCLSLSTTILAQTPNTTTVQPQTQNNTIPNPINYLTHSSPSTTQTPYTFGQFNATSNAFTIEPLEDLKLSAQGKPVIEQTVITNLPANTQSFYRAEIAYAIADDLQPIAYRQFLSKPYGQDPENQLNNLQIDPTFLQSEYGTGVQMQVKSYLMETGIKTITNAVLGNNPLQTQVFSKFRATF